MTVSDVGLMAMGSSRSLLPLITIYRVSVRSKGVRITQYSRPGDPGNFGSESLDVVLLFLEDLGRDEHGEVAVLDSHLLDLSIEPALDCLPDGVGPRLEDVTSGNIVVVEHISLDEDLQYSSQRQ